MKSPISFWPLSASARDEIYAVWKAMAVATVLRFNRSTTSAASSDKRPKV
ncbi:hypothetical protein [Sphingobium lignivorans]|uniref:Uncharacterized protein n=1 Tax=Sphingobium lignivorans TaxID=2735886 RepID=A0ABR6NF74_9SPHN|nr:hypothetical protein [Sphingobium lignivorans]MBB5985934.1 hypothetical protein [Sphingobium lignivorans]